jgi:aldose 1-epimerase
MTVIRQLFGTLPDGTPIHRWTIGADTLQLSAIEYGAIITSLVVADRGGHLDDVVLGYDSLGPYLRDDAYLGAVVGRYANRIARGRLVLDGRAHQLTINEGIHHLHGGSGGFSRSVWSASLLELPSRAALRFERISVSGEDGYPGTLKVAVTYEVTDQQVSIEYTATTDEPTVVNLTQHTYFNLAAAGTVLDHELAIHATHYTPVLTGLIPTGEIAPVRHTPFDLRRSTPIRSRLRTSHEQITLAGGFDHNWALSSSAGSHPAASLYEPTSGRRLDIWTTEPGLQFYDGHLLRHNEPSRDGRQLAPYRGLCLETQHFPDSPNHANFPATTLNPCRKYCSETVWRFTSV